MSSAPRIYLDNAATSFPKPAAVHRAVAHAMQDVGAAAGRSATRRALEVQEVIARCRQRAARILGAERPERIVFTCNATDSLNLALYGLLRPGDHVVTSAIEHNSVLRPLRHLSDRGVEVTHVPADDECRIDPDSVRQALQKNTRLVAITHASNVTGTIQPIEHIGEIARSVSAFFLVDAAQSAGHIPIDLANSPVDLLACAGHKGLLGPLGTGLLYVRPGMESHLESVRQGGTGSRSDEDRQPDTLPDKYESGNLNVPGLFGLEAGLAWIEERTVAEMFRLEHHLTATLLEGLNRRGISVHGPRSPERRLGVISLTADGWEPQELAGVLEQSFGIETRAGLHCAPGAHRAAGTFDSGGTLRLSIGPFNAADDIAAAVDALGELARG